MNCGSILERPGSAPTGAAAVAPCAHEFCDAACALSTVPAAAPAASRKKLRRENVRRVLDFCSDLLMMRVRFLNAGRLPPIRPQQRQDFEAELRLDSASHSLARHERFTLCTEGVHGVLSAEAMTAILCRRTAAQDSARALVAAPRPAGGLDDATALVIDVAGIPATDLGA